MDVGIGSEELAASIFRAYGVISTLFQNIGGMPTYQTIRRLIPDLNLYTVLKMAAVLIHSVQTTHQTPDPQTYHVRR